MTPAEFIDRHPQELTGRLQQLVRVSTINPPGENYTAITGKLELEYEGELKGGDAIARELIRLAVGKVFTRIFEGESMSQVVQWFELGGTLKLDESQPSWDAVRELGKVQGLLERTKRLGLSGNEPDALRLSAGEFILEGLYAHRRIGRNEEQGFAAEPRKREAAAQAGPMQRPPKQNRDLQ